MQNTVLINDVLENMKNVLVRTVEEFGKPTTYVTVQNEKWIYNKRINYLC